MTIRRFALLAAICGMAVVIGWHLPDLRGPAVGPVAEFPAHIDLGERQPNEAVTAVLPVANTGDQPLVLDDIQTSCSCAGLEVEQNGRPARLTELTLPPGERIDLTFRMAVGVPPGQAQQVSIGFRTNDPRIPTGRVTAVVSRVIGRPSASPSELAFGSVGFGRPAAEQFTIRPNAVPGLRVVRAVSSRPERFTAEVVPAADADTVAQIRVALATTDPGEAVGEIVVELAAADGAPHILRVPVSGRVRRPVEPAPSHLLIPDGRDRMTTYLVGATAEPFAVTVAGVSDGLTATLEPEPSLADRFQVRLVVSRSGGAVRPTGMVRLTVTPGSAPPFPLEVPVSCPARP